MPLALTPEQREVLADATGEKLAAYRKRRDAEEAALAAQAERPSRWGSMSLDGIWPEDLVRLEVDGNSVHATFAEEALQDAIDTAFGATCDAIFESKWAYAEVSKDGQTVTIHVLNQDDDAITISLPTKSPYSEL